MVAELIGVASPEDRLGSLTKGWIKDVAVEMESLSCQVVPIGLIVEKGWNQAKAY